MFLIDEADGSPLSAGLIRVLPVGAVLLPCADQSAGTNQEQQQQQQQRGRMETFRRTLIGQTESEPLMPGDKPQGGRVGGREGVWEEMKGVVCFGALGPWAGGGGTLERKCSRECNLLKGNERYVRVPCVSSRGEMIDWERLEEGGMNWPRGGLQLVFKKYTHFVFVYAGNACQSPVHWNAPGSEV